MFVTHRGDAVVWFTKIHERRLGLGGRRIIVGIEHEISDNGALKLVFLALSGPLGQKIVFGLPTFRG